MWGEVIARPQWDEDDHVAGHALPAPPRRLLCCSPRLAWLVVLVVDCGGVAVAKYGGYGGQEGGVLRLRI